LNHFDTLFLLEKERNLKETLEMEEKMMKNEAEYDVQNRIRLPREFNCS